MRSTFLLVLAEVSKQVIPSLEANTSASSRVTYLYACRSHLFPTRKIAGFLVLYLQTSAFQSLISWNVFLSQRSNTRMMPCAPLQYAVVMVLNFYCPAVSHIWSLTVLPSCSMVLILKSTPMVGRKVQGKNLSAYLRRRLDLPTDELPMRSTLNVKSYSVLIMERSGLAIKSKIIVFPLEISVFIRNRQINSVQVRYNHPSINHQYKCYWFILNQMEALPMHFDTFHFFLCFRLFNN